MDQCRVCGSFAINHNLHGRDGTDPYLCDVCYWRKRVMKWIVTIENEVVPNPWDDKWARKREDE